MRNCLGAHFDGIKMCERNVLSGFRAHTSITYSEAFILQENPWRSRCAKKCAICIPTAPTHRRSCNIEFVIKSAKTLVV